MPAKANFFAIFGKYREKGQQRIGAIAADLPVKGLLEVPSIQSTWLCLIWVGQIHHLPATPAGSPPPLLC